MTLAVDDVRPRRVVVTRLHQHTLDGILSLLDRHYPLRHTRQDLSSQRLGSDRFEFTGRQASGLDRSTDLVQFERHQASVPLAQRNRPIHFSKPQHHASITIYSC